MSLSLEEQKETLDEIVPLILDMANQMVSENEQYDLIYGHINKIDGICCPTSIDGLCRMKTCLCLEDGDEWIFEDCAGCEQLLNGDEKLVRYPNPSGGWSGCFCSVECIRNNYCPDYKESARLTLLEILIDNLDNLDKKINNDFDFNEKIEFEEKIEIVYCPPCQHIKKEVIEIEISELNLEDDFYELEEGDVDF